MKLHLGCGEKYLEGYVNVDFPDSEQSIIKTKADVYYTNMQELSYAENSIDEIRSHHLFEHFSRAEALKLLTRWRRWLKPDGVLVIETPDFTTSAAMFLHSSSRRRRFQLSRHIYGSQEARWAQHKDYWDKDKFLFVLDTLGFKAIKVRRYWNGLARHAEKIPKVGAALSRIPESVYVPVLNGIGAILPERFYQKYGSHKMPNILVRASKHSAVLIDEEKIASHILSMYLVGREGKELLDVWMKEYRDF